MSVSLKERKATNLCPEELPVPVEPPVGSVPSEVPASPGIPVGREPTAVDTVTVDVPSIEIYIVV